MVSGNMASSGSTTLLLPPVKNVTVYRNGDPFHTGRRFVVNHRQVVTMEAFLNDVTQCIQAPLAVRTLYTPRQGHKVKELQDLQSGAQYVAAGFERFKKLDYLNTGLKRQPVTRADGAQARLPDRPNVSAKWRKYIPQPCIIHVFRNGDLRCSPFRFIIPRTWQHDLDQILGLVTEKASLRTGAVRRLFTLEGVGVSSAEELQSGQYYVAVGAERFKKLPYVELLVPKASERTFPGNRRVSKRYEGRKAASGPDGRYSDSVLLDSPELDGRRVKSTGDEVGEAALPGPAPQMRSEKEESSIFYARPVKVRVRNPTHPRPPPKTGPAQASVFKGGTRRRREEMQGAEEVLEDENTAVELPVDQKEAELVEEEGIVRSPVPDSDVRNLFLTKVTDRTMFDEKNLSPEPEEPDNVTMLTEQARNSPAESSSSRCKEDAVNGRTTPKSPQAQNLSSVESVENALHSKPDLVDVINRNQELKTEMQAATPNSRASLSAFSASQSSQKSGSIQGQKSFVRSSL
ncbi:hypothetical protein UPYG_G00229630 [Umbra pygmaea]|uniref:Doublecortin domain-containing protein n=1 Tax=Umbra pygmaea TaxID=75934 RepID=A0ABD0WD55_UMBPY